MQCLTHVLRTITLLVTLMVTNLAYGEQMVIDKLYCDGTALMAKAGAEAKQRGESLPKWKKNLEAMKGYGVRNKDNVLYRVLPRVISEATAVYRWRKTPMETYTYSFNTCMQNDFGQLVSIN